MEKTYLIKNMKCAGCANNITEALNQLAGVTDLEIKIPEKKVIVTFDENKIRLEKIEETLKIAGYPVA